MQRISRPPECGCSRAFRGDVTSTFFSDYLRKLCFLAAWLRYASRNNDVQREPELKIEETPQPAVLPTDPEGVLWNGLLFVALTTMAVVILRIL
jgi:hypothetical protein